MINAPLNIAAYQLFQDGILALADIEATGIRVDVPYLESQITALSDQILNAERTIWHTSEAREWKAMLKGKNTIMNIDSTTQLSSLLFKTLNYKPTKETARGNAAVDDEVLRHIGTPFTKAILAKRKLTKVRDTYLTGLLREQVDGVLHPSFNLHLVQTYRSSSDSPNFQNIPVRDPEQGSVIRRAIIPHNPGDVIGEVDYSGAEIRIAACYHKDPSMLKYIHDPTKDLHRDMACECYLLKPSQVTKAIRNETKGDFVFAEFYGSYFELVAPNLWKASGDLVMADGTQRLVREVLIEKGIKTAGQFTDHIQEVERHFWEDRFPVYNQWKKNWYAAYLKRGYFNTITGFRCQGPMRRNECINYPVQGSSFHCLLWSLIQIHKWLVSNEMESSIIGQIHDSIIFNLAPKEAEIVLRKAKKVMCEDVRKHWPWLIVPLDVDAEVAPPGKSWNDKVETNSSKGTLERGGWSFDAFTRSHPGGVNYDHFSGS